MRPPRHALLLTAGLGTRLRPLTLVRAKPAIPVAGEPLVRRIARWLVAGGVTDLVLNLHYLPETLTAVMGDGRDLGARVRYSWEQPVVLGSAGGPRLALSIIGAEVFLIVNGDTLTDVDLGELARAHASSGALVTLALVPNRDPVRYGGVRLDNQARVIGFVQRGPAAAGSFHFVGVQMVQADALRSVPQGQPINSVGGVYDDLIARRPGALHGFVTAARFWDVGTVPDYWNTSAFFSDCESHSPVPPDGSRRVRIDPTAHIDRSILWDDVEVGRDATLEECIITDGVRIPEGGSYRRTILMRQETGVVAVPFEIAPPR
jgi:mannose-1-phosphate guanylyltransferase